MSMAKKKVTSKHRNASPKNTAKATLGASIKPLSSADLHLDLVFSPWPHKIRAVSAKQFALAAKGSQVLLLGGEAAGNHGTWVRMVQKHLAPWQRDQFSSQIDKGRDLFFFQTAAGPLWIIRAKPTGITTQVLPDSDYSFFRDQMGSIYPLFKSLKLGQLSVREVGLSSRQRLGAMVGLLLSRYQYLSTAKETVALDWVTENASKAEVESLWGEAVKTSQGVNLARHLTNLPPNVLQPDSFSQLVRELPWTRRMTVSAWDEKKLQEERMNLHLAVGRGGEYPPQLLHLKYRGKENPGKNSTFGFVGKGLTFDSGGLDIKPAAGMRWMKKDMGGAATVLGLAWAMDQAGIAGNYDFILCLAENAIDARSFRPGDVYTSRAGFQIEIHNTDAEGRLVLADGLDVAANLPGISGIINVATLTGANKVALGAQIAGLYDNNNELAQTLLDCSEARGDLSWRMPMYRKYFSQLHSHFSDFTNCSDGFGGAITAALFLEKFVKGIPWAHFDIYAWADRADGAMTATGGNGQMVQALFEFVQRRSGESLPVS